MAFGIKQKNIECSKEYTMQELFDAIQAKGVEWGEVGEPSLVKQAGSFVIAFPPIDRQNQIWIMSTKMGDKPAAKFTVLLSHNIAGDYGNTAKNIALDTITSGFAGMGSMFGKKAKAGESGVEKVLALVGGLGL